MKTIISALTLGLVVAFSAPAFAGSDKGAYVGDMLTDKSAAPAPDKAAENKAAKREARREARAAKGGAS